MQTINTQKIPNTLKALPQWVVYGRREQPFVTQYTVDKKGRQKIDKVPYNAKTHTKAQSNNPATWSDFETALNVYEAGYYNGLGFVFSEQDNLVGIDLDHVLNPETGKLKDLAAELLEQFPNTYIEVSPSGDGLHIWVKGRAQRCGKGTIEKAIELYDAQSSRYFTVTGHQWADSSNEPEPHQEALDWLHQHHFDSSLKSKTRVNTSSDHVTASTFFNRDELLRRAHTDTTFISLWNGEYTRYPSQSEADLALCHKLAFYLQGHTTHVDQAFRASGLMRSKWDEVHYSSGQTYGTHTVQLACENVTQYWQADYRSKRSGNTQTQNHPNAELLTRPSQAFSLDDLGNSERLLHYYGDRILYCGGYWLLWNGMYWETDKTLTIEAWAKNTVKAISQEAEQATSPEHAEAIRKWAKQSKQVAKISNLLIATRSDVAISPNQLDQQGMQLNCRNGTINLEKGQLQAHQQTDYHTRMIPVDYDAMAECPQWLKFLETTFNHNTALIDYIQRAVGYSLTTSISEQCLFIMHGTGANGKSTFVDTLKMLLGEYAKTSAPDMLIAKKQTAHPTEIADLKGARFVSVMETPRGEKLDENRVKQMTGDSTLKARHLYQDFFEFSVEFKLWMATNHKPNITGNDYAIWRRVKLIPFTVTIAPENRDKHLLDKLKHELSGILNWAIQGCLNWQQSGLNPPQTVVNATEEYKAEEDTLSQFLLDCCIENNEHKVENKALYQAYNHFCQELGIKPDSNTQFGKVMKERGFETRKSGGKYYRLGVSLKRDKTEDEQTGESTELVDATDSNSHQNNQVTEAVSNDFPYDVL